MSITINQTTDYSKANSIHDMEYNSWYITNAGNYIFRIQDLKNTVLYINPKLSKLKLELCDTKVVKFPVKKLPKDFSITISND